MKFLCSDCSKIFWTRSEAQNCCQPTVIAVEDYEVMACSDGGELCENPDCEFCRGTGLQWESKETADRVLGRSRP